MKLKAVEIGRSGIVQLWDEDDTPIATVLRWDGPTEDGSFPAWEDDGILKRAHTLAHRFNQFEPVVDELELCKAAFIGIQAGARDTGNHLLAASVQDSIDAIDAALAAAGEVQG